MHTLNKWIRQLHRWLVIPFLLAILVLVTSSIRGGEEFKLPVWLSVIAIGSLLSLLLTGLYMFAQHYLTKWRRTR
jgi:Mn2+/Fe2+ NRAMP family transporter